MIKGYWLSLVLVLSGCILHAQSNTGYLYISYQISVKENKKASLSAESYDGATKNIFISGDRARIRLVSLMRTQSLYYFNNDQNRQAVIVKESGKQKEQAALSADGWKKYNADFDGAACVIMKETVRILQYNCRKAVIMLKSGAQVVVYYTDEIANTIFPAAEPMFGCIPGIVLKYIYTTRSTTTSYTAQQVSQDKIAEKVFELN